MWRMTARVGMLITVIGCTAAAVPSAGSGATVTANRVLARSTAGRLLDMTPLPAGAVAVGSDPSSGSRLVGSGAGAPATPDVVAYHRYYRVPGRWQTLFSAVEADPTPGMKQDGSGASGTPSGVTSRSADFSLVHPPAGVYQAGVQISLAAATGNNAAMRVDAWAIWLVPRPTWERVPRSSRTVQLFADTPAGGRSSVATVTSRRIVGSLVRFLNGLPRLQPGVRSCPVLRGPLYELRFRAVGGSRVLARAVQTGCGAISFWLGSRRGPALADDYRLVAVLRRLGVLPAIKRGAGRTEPAPP
jgi:hypothetical protein